MHVPLLDLANVYLKQQIVSAQDFVSWFVEDNTVGLMKLIGEEPQLLFDKT